MLSILDDGIEKDHPDLAANYVTMLPSQGRALSFGAGRGWRSSAAHGTLWWEFSLAVVGSKGSAIISHIKETELVHGRAPRTVRCNYSKLQSK